MRLKNNQLQILFGSLIYSLALAIVLRDFLYPNFAEYGFRFDGYSVYNITILIVCVSVLALIVPRSIFGSIESIIIILYLHLIIPALVSVCFAYDYMGLEISILLQLLITFSFAVPIILNPSAKKLTTNLYKPNKKIVNLLVILQILGTIYIVYHNRDIMKFVSHADIYVQRDIGLAKSLSEGYIQSYFGKVVPILLIVFGLACKNRIALIAGISGLLVIYMVIATKGSIAYIFVIPLLYFLMRNYPSLLKTRSLLLIYSAALSLLLFGVTNSDIFTLAIWLFAGRTLLITGSFIVSYYEYFTSAGFTYLKNITGIGLIIPMDSVHEKSSRWPSIGHIVGENYLGIQDLNANANFIASDGIAAFGVYGIIFIGFILSIILYIIRIITKGIDPVVVVCILIPVALTLTNGSIFSVLTSHGLFLYLIVFSYIRYKKFSN